MVPPPTDRHDFDTTDRIRRRAIERKHDQSFREVEACTVCGSTRNYCCAPGMEFVRYLRRRTGSHDDS